MPVQKCYNIMITGKVQDIGFRVLVEDIARLYDLRGFAFNDVDGSVKLVCCGENGIISEFLEEIRDRGALKGAVVDEIVKEEVPHQIYLPAKFMRLYTDELADISRKLDTGNELLRQISSGITQIISSTSGIPDIKNGIDSLNTKFDSFTTEQKEHNQWMKEHNQRLEKILEKLSEK